MKTPIYSSVSLTASSGVPYAVASGTIYLMMQGQLARYEFGYFPWTTEGDWRFAPDRAGSIGDLEVYIGANTRTTATTFTLMKNGVSTGYTATVGAGVTGWVGASGGPATVAEGDLLSVRLVNGTGAGSITVEAIQSTFDATSGDTVAHHTTSGDYQFSQAVTTNRLTQNVSGSGEGNSFGNVWSGEVSAPFIQARVGLDATAVSARVHISVNTTTVAAQVELYVNGVASGLKATIPAGTIGRFRGTGSVNLNVNDKLDWRFNMTGSGTGSLRLGNIQLGLVYDGQGFDVWSLARAASTIQGYNDQTYRIGIPWFAITTNVAGPYHRFKMPAGTVGNLWIRVGIGASSTNWPVSSLVLAGANAITLTVPTPLGNATILDTTSTATTTGGESVWFAFRTTGFSQSLSATGFTVVDGSAPPVEIDAGSGQLNFTGQQAAVTAPDFIMPGPGQLTLTGGQALVSLQQTITPGGGQLTFTGGQADVVVGAAVDASPGQLTFTGQQPFIALDLFLAVTQQAAIALADPPPPDVRASQQAAIALGEIVPGMRAAQQAVIVLATGVPCVTYWCQVWIIRRLDGEGLAFTSLDRSLQFQGLTARSCASLMASATEGAANIGAVGNMELQGIIDSDAITDADLWAGAYDGARVEVWLAPWAGTDTARRLAAGWAGKVSQGERGFTMEVLGPGARLEQQAITKPFTPACRWRDLGQDGCPVDPDALKVAGVITTAVNRRRFAASALAVAPANPFTQGRVVFLTGANAGFRSETKDFDAASGTFTLWLPTPQPMAPGDTFEAFPGCDKTKPTCQAYGAFADFGGFPDIPGADSLTETPDAKY